MDTKRDTDMMNKDDILDMYEDTIATEGEIAGILSEVGEFDPTHLGDQEIKDIDYQVQVQRFVDGNMPGTPEYRQRVNAFIHSTRKDREDVLYDIFLRRKQKLSQQPPSLQQPYWSEEEDQRLHSLYEQYKTQGRISNTPAWPTIKQIGFPNRSVDSVKHRWKRLQESGQA